VSAETTATEALCQPVQFKIFDTLLLSSLSEILAPTLLDIVKYGLVLLTWGNVSAFDAQIGIHCHYPPYITKALNIFFHHTKP